MMDRCDLQIANKSNKKVLILFNSLLIVEMKIQISCLLMDHNKLMDKRQY